MGILTLFSKKDSLSAKNGRNCAFWNKVSTVYINVYQAMHKEYLANLGQAFLPVASSTGKISLNVDDEGLMQRFNIYEIEFERYCGFVFRTWFYKKFPDLTNEEKTIVDNIAGSVLKQVMGTDGNNEYGMRLMAASCGRWKDYDAIDIGNNLYGWYDGEGHKVKVNSSLEKSSGYLVALFEAAAWMLTDCVYATYSTSTSYSYSEVQDYVKSNPVSDIKLRMNLISLYGQLTDTYVEISQTINWMATNDFYKK